MQVVIIVDPDEMVTENQPQVVMELSDNTQRNFVVTHNNDGLTLTDPEVQLQYQFPAAMISALFSIND